MPLQIIDHTAASWAKRVRYQNGAITYSRDIVNSQSQNWIDFFEGSTQNILISTCPRVHELHPSEIDFDHLDLVIQYLHAYPYDDPIAYVREIDQNIKSRFKGCNIIFISAYKAYAQLLSVSGFPTVYVPMSIDTALLSDYVDNQSPRCDDRIIWFGNLYKGKSNLYSKLKHYLLDAGYKLDIISKGLFNDNQKVSQELAWTMISNYKYGIGVGRCALEMYHLGLKVVIAGAKFGGLLASDNDFEVQQSTNFNSRLITYDRDPASVLKYLPHSYMPKIHSISAFNHVDFYKNEH